MAWKEAAQMTLCCKKQQQNKSLEFWLVPAHFTMNLDPTQCRLKDFYYLLKDFNMYLNKVFIC